jgi:hypothetical protein
MNWYTTCVRKMAMRLAPAPEAACLILFVFGSSPGKAVYLVTPEEAAMPDDPYNENRGAPTPGPEIEIKLPSLRGLVKSPFHLKILLTAHGGTVIDRESISIIYRKVPAIDVTERLNAFIHSDGIDIREAELPPGKHAFRIDAKDSRGRDAPSLYLNIGIAK